MGEDDPALIPVTIRTQKQLSNAAFRDIFTAKLISAQKNISGSAAKNLQQLYLQLGLDKYAISIVDH